MRHLSQIILDNPSDKSADKIYKAVCADVKEKLDVDLVSIWVFDEDREKINCVCCLDKSNGDSLVGIDLYRDNYPQYFAAILEGLSIQADDVYSYPATKELVTDYFLPNGIKSLLDYIIQWENKPIAVICCETTDTQRHWTRQDVEFIRSITVSAGFELAKK